MAPAPVLTKVTGGIGAYARIRTLTQRVAEDEAFLLDLDLGWRFWAGEFYRLDGSVVCCRLLNPYVGVSAGWETEALRARGGVGLTLPVSNLFAFDGAPELLVWESADVAHGYRDGWLAMGETVALVVRGEVEGRVAWLHVGAEVALAAMVPLVRPGSPVLVPRDGGAPFTRYQFFASIAGVVEPWVELGVRLGVAGWAGMGDATPSIVGQTRSSFGPSPGPPSGLRIDDAQISASPYARLTFEPGFVEARGTILFDDPNGLWSETTYFAVSLAGGAELD